MITKIAIAIVTATGLVVASLINKLRLINERDTISKDLAIYKMLPKKSSVRKDLLKRIDENVASSLINNRSVRRDIPGAISKIFGFVLGISLAWYISYNSAMLFDWRFWLGNPIYLVSELTAILAALYFLINIASTLEKRLRDV